MEIRHGDTLLIPLREELSSEEEAAFADQVRDRFPGVSVVGVSCTQLTHAIVYRPFRKPGGAA